MEKYSFPALIIINIVCRKSIIGAGMVKKQTVNSGNGQYDRVRGILSRSDDHTVRCTLFFQFFQKHSTECIRSDLPHKKYVRPEKFHGKAGVGNRSA